MPAVRLQTTFFKLNSLQKLTLLKVSLRPPQNVDTVHKGSEAKIEKFFVQVRYDLSSVSGKRILFIGRHSFAVFIEFANNAV